MTRKHPLFAYLEKSGRSLSDVARDAEVSRMTLYRLTKGDQNATLDLLNRVSKATGGEVPVEAFLVRAA